MDAETPKIPIAKHASHPARRMTTALRNSGNHSSAPPAPGVLEEVVWINFNKDNSAFLKNWAASEKPIKKKMKISVADPSEPAAYHEGTQPEFSARKRG